MVRTVSFFVKMKKSVKYIKIVINIIVLGLFFISCGSGGGGGDDASAGSVVTIPRMLFGANYDWKDLAGKSVSYGELI
ncbi:MAG TPA: hypothetical protein PLT75_19530, partial [Spirochaetota bacterium]|nr:hypothetical protein [Spirochaetota bacterium]